MAIDSLSAANAYRNQLKLMENAGDAAGMADESGQSSFADMVENAVKDSINTQYTTEASKMEALTGKVELSDLVTAVANAELTLNTVVAVRDRVINAYQEIIRMPI